MRIVEEYVKLVQNAISSAQKKLLTRLEKVRFCDVSLSNQAQHAKAMVGVERCEREEDGCCHLQSRIDRQLEHVREESARCARSECKEPGGELGLRSALVYQCHPAIGRLEVEVRLPGRDELNVLIAERVRDGLLHPDPSSFGSLGTRIIEFGGLGCREGPN